MTIDYICTSPQIKYLVPSFVVSVGAFLIYNIMELHVKELRIGNYVIYQGENIVEINGILEDEIHTIENGFEYINEFQPIPLTEEWLLKFGFEKTNESKDVEWYRFNSFEVSTYNEGEVVYFVYQHLVLNHITKVHQLQNLYFALTGKELTLTNETK